MEKIKRTCPLATQSQQGIATARLVHLLLIFFLRMKIYAKKNLLRITINALPCNRSHLITAFSRLITRPTLSTHFKHILLFYESINF